MKRIVQPLAIAIGIATILLFTRLVGNNSQQGQSKSSIKEETVFDLQPLLEIIEHLMADLRNKKISEAYADLTSKEFQKTTPLESFKQLVNDYDVLSQNKYFQYQSFYFENNIATFQGLLISKNGVAVQAEFDLVKEEGKWKIFGMQLFKQEMEIIRPVSPSSKSK